MHSHCTAIQSNELPTGIYVFLARRFSDVVLVDKGPKTQDDTSEPWLPKDELASHQRQSLETCLAAAQERTIRDT